MACVLAAASIVGPVSAATNQHVTIAQASQQTGTLSGRVLGSTGYPLSGAAVTVRGSGVNTSSTTGGDGLFTFAVPPGLYTISVNHGGYQTGTSDVAVTAGQSISVSVQLTESSLSNLTTIGRTSTSASGNTGARFNISSTENLTLSQQQITERDTPNLAPIVNELPGINILHSASNPNQDFIVHGFQQEVKDELDGHPVSSGTSGTFLTQFMQAGIFGGVDVAEGFGLNGPTAGQSGVATVNLRTPDFTAKDSAFLQGGLDSYNGSFYNLLVDKNFGYNDKFSVILGRSITGYSGPTAGYQANAIASGGAAIVNSSTFQAPYLGGNLIEFQGDFSNAYNLTAELAKLRYKFSDATSLALEYVGFYGRWDPQGGAYGQFEGFGTVPQCLNGTAPVAQGAAGCTVTSKYNAPSADGLIGQTNVPYYTFYPGSDVRQTQPNFNAEFKTTYKDDTILFRPYAATIRRLIDGSNESGTPGDAGSWYEVTNPANCTVQFTPASTANGGASGPCYLANEAANGPGYVTNPTVPHSFATEPITALPAGQCTPTNPCYTNATNQDNQGIYGFGSPYTTLEIDKLAGYTFSYIHPVGANIYNVSLDHYYDDAQSFVNDFSSLIPGCQFIASGSALPIATANPAVGSGTPKIGGIGSQASCPGISYLNSSNVPTLGYKPSPISVPETFSSITDISVTGQFQLRNNLEFDLGNYFTHYLINGQQINPKLIAEYEAAGVNPAYIPVPAGLSGIQNSASHYDPHLAFVFRPSRDLSLRLNGGSSISIPYASQVSGFTQAQQGAASTTITQPNANLLPEELVGEDFGIDYRFHNGTIFSTDFYYTIDHNPWIASKIVLANGPLPGLEQTQVTYGSQQLNGAQKNSEGVDFQLTDEPSMGFGYRLMTSLDRAYYLNMPATLFSAPPPGVTPAYQAYYNGAQVGGIPYLRGYAEVQYAGVKRLLLRIGMDYEGSNNEYNAPAFVFFDAGARFNVGNGFSLQATGENITNVNWNSNLGAGLYDQGVVPVGAYANSTGYVYGASAGTFGVVQPGFRTFRFSVVKRL